MVDEAGKVWALTGRGVSYKGLSLRALGGWIRGLVGIFF
jgi:hypothetical protein